MTVCYNPDDPITTFSRGSNRPWVTGSISAFDLFCTYKGGILGELTARGAREVLHLPFAWDDLVPGDDPRDAGDGETDYDLLFVGNGDRQREALLCNILEHARFTDLRIGVYGNWGGVRSKLLRDVLAGRQASFGEMQDLVRRSCLSLNILRRQNEGSHNMRTFEIPGAGGLMMSQAGAEQESWFAEGSSALYFSSAEEAVEKALWARRAPGEVAKMREAASAIAARNTYRDRAATILSRVAEIQSSRGGRRPVRVGIVATHPIQYQAPVFRDLAARPDVDLDVFFASMQGTNANIDPGFGAEVTWDVPVLEGYRWTLLENLSRSPSVNSLLGTNTPSIYEEIARRQLDAVLIQGWAQRFYLQAIKASVNSDTPLMIRCEGRRIGSQSKLKEFVKRFVLSRLLKRFSAYLWIGTPNLEFYRWCGVDEDKLMPARYCVENERFALGDDERESARVTRREEFGLDESSVAFLFSGKFIEKKRPGDLLAAARILTEDLGVAPESFAIVLMGSGSLEPELRKEADQLRCQVIFTGFINQSEIPETYGACDILVLPSDYWETWGLVVNEAMAASLPAIVSNRVGSCGDLVVDGETGFPFAFGDAVDLANRMAQAIKQREELPHMGRAARKLIQSYSVSAVADSIEAAARELAASKGMKWP
ncbi:glycosyltransferase [Planctomycetota bacterium]|nr:glycosyltransferase [Planctomycetota bacterium]